MVLSFISYFLFLASQYSFFYYILVCHVLFLSYLLFLPSTPPCCLLSILNIPSFFILTVSSTMSLKRGPDDNKTPDDKRRKPPPFCRSVCVWDMIFLYFIYLFIYFYFWSCCLIVFWGNGNGEKDEFWSKSKWGVFGFANVKLWIAFLFNWGAKFGFDMCDCEGELMLGKFMCTCTDVVECPPGMKWNEKLFVKLIPFSHLSWCSFMF